MSEFADPRPLQRAPCARDRRPDRALRNAADAPRRRPASHAATTH